MKQKRPTQAFERTADASAQRRHRWALVELPLARNQDLMSLEKLKAEQEVASKLKREGGGSVREFRKVALSQIEELVGRPAGIRLKWEMRQPSQDTMFDYKPEGVVEQGKWHFSSMYCGRVSVLDLDPTSGVGIEILNFILSPSNSGYEMEVKGKYSGESYKARVGAVTLPILLRDSKRSSLEYRCLWNSSSDNSKVARGIKALLAGESLDSEFSFSVPPPSVPPAKGCLLLFALISTAVTLGVILVH